jgi:polysaccharide export outer membrane protein
MVNEGHYTRFRLDAGVGCGTVVMRMSGGATSMSRTRWMWAVLMMCVLGMPAVHAQQASYVVKPGDTLEISVWKEPDLQRTVLVRPDGAFSFPLVGEVDARGKTVAELNKVVSERLAKYISGAVVTVSVQEIKGNKIFVLGQVNKPGEFIVNPSVNIMQALSMAGGMTPFASVNDIIVLRGQGDKQVAMAFRYPDVVRGRRLETNIELLAGDVVVVP